jgi:hypothetical protein
MPISFKCPNCQGANTQGDDWAGMRAPCQRCGSYLSVPSQSTLDSAQVAEGLPSPTSVRPPPVPTSPGTWTKDLSRPRDSFDDDFDDDDLRRPHALAPAWNVVRIGLGLMFWGSIAASALSVLFAGLVMLAFQLDRAAGRVAPEALVIVAYLLIGLMLLVGLLVFIGQCLCIAVPPESKARGLAISSAAGIVVLVVLSAGFLVLRMVLFRGGVFADEFTTRILPLVGMILFLMAGTTTHVLFILFLKTVARYFSNAELVQSTNNYLLFYFVTMGLVVMVQCLGAGARDPGLAMAFFCFALVLLGLFVALAVWYLVLLARTRASIH